MHTVLGDTPSRRAIGRGPSPSALLKTIFARSTHSWGIVRARTHDARVARSSSLTTNFSATYAMLLRRRTLLIIQRWNTSDCSSHPAIRSRDILHRGGDLGPAHNHSW